MSRSNAAPEPRPPADPPAELEQTIRDFLAEYHPNGRRGIDKIGASDNLWRVVSSLNLLLLVEYIEEKFAIKVAPIDFAPQHFSTIASIAKFVVARRP